MIAAIVLALAVMQMSSGDFVDGGAIPAVLMARGCGGQNHAPSLIWKDAPKGTHSFALILHDPDAPVAGGFDHWVLYDIPGNTHQLSGNASHTPGRTGLASTGNAAYYGPCPPPGPAHHYIFTLYALDVTRISSDAPLTAPELRRRIDGHILAQATLEATAAHP